jgi:SAM-dependent methyltransferase
MITARIRFLSAGYYAPLAQAVARLAVAWSAPPAQAGPILDLGAGPGFYLGHVLDACHGHVGIALDISTFAARRAARCHVRAGAVVADAQGSLPVLSGSAALLLSLFAPRPLPEMRRVLHPEGHLLVVTPDTTHLASLREPLGLLDIEEGKDERLLAQAAACFALVHEERLALSLSLQREDAFDLLSMGPAAYHVAAEERAARAAALALPIVTSASFVLRVFKPVLRNPATCAGPSLPR